MGLQTLALFANEARFCTFWVFFRSCSLQNEVGDPPFFYITDITNSSSYSGKSFRKKSMLKNFRANVLNDERPSTAFANQIPAIHVNHRSSGLGNLNQGHTPPGFDSSFSQSSAPHNQIGLSNILHSAVGLSNGVFLASHGQYPSSFINHNIALTSHLEGKTPSVIYSSQQQQSYAGEVVGIPGPSTNSFQLKWVAGTIVTQCYGCGGHI